MSSLAMTALNLSMRGAIAGAAMGGVLFFPVGKALAKGASNWETHFIKVGIVAGLVNGAAIGAIRAVLGQNAVWGGCIGFILMTAVLFQEEKWTKWGNRFIENTLAGTIVGGLCGALVAPIFLK